jgi:valyl-tRNA synthetase
MKVGRRLAIKLLNASKFTLGLTEGPTDPAAVSEPLDRALLGRLAGLVDEATAAFDGYDYARALERTETFFWDFCDEYLELVKGRAYGAAGEAGAASARATLQLTLSTLLRLFAPFLPYVTEEVWSWWREGSVHRAAWPTAGELRDPGGSGSAADPLVYEVGSWVLGEVRKAKTTEKRSLRTEVTRAVVRDSGPRLTALAAVAADVREAGRITVLDTETAPDATGAAVVVTLAPETDTPAR